MATIKKACKGTSYPKSSSVSSRLGSPSKAKKGGSFDLNKDGKTTFKDVLIGRGVLPKTAKKGKMVKKAQTGAMGQKGKGVLTPGPDPISLIGSAIPAAGAVKTGKTKERTADGNYVKISKTRETPSGTKTVNKTRRTLQGVLRGAPRMANYKKGGKMKKCAYGCK